VYKTLSNELKSYFLNKNICLINITTNWTNNVNNSDVIIIDSDIKAESIALVNKKISIIYTYDEYKGPEYTYILNEYIKYFISSKALLSTNDININIINTYVNSIDSLNIKHIKKIFLNNKSSLNIRDVELKDIHIMFNWVNDPDVRSNALNTTPIKWEEHEKWFTSRIKSAKTKIYILEWLNKPIGQIRFDSVENYWLIDYSIDVNFRGFGLGKLILEYSKEKFTSPTNWIAYVKSSNQASLHVFRSLGFQEISNINSILKFELMFKH
jgi:L-amino acid N-acyltransferase YncA